MNSESEYDHELFNADLAERDDLTHVTNKKSKSSTSQYSKTYSWLQESSNIFIAHALLSMTSFAALFFVLNFADLFTSYEEYALLAATIFLALSYVVCGYFFLDPTKRKSYILVAQLCCLLLTVSGVVFLLGGSEVEPNVLFYLLNFPGLAVVGAVSALAEIFGLYFLENFLDIVTIPLSAFVPPLLFLLGMQLKKRRLAKIAGETASLEDKVKLP